MRSLQCVTLLHLPCGIKNTELACNKKISGTRLVRRLTLVNFQCNEEKLQLFQLKVAHSCYVDFKSSTLASSNKMTVIQSK